MIYIRVEDSTDGFVLCQNIVRIYFKDNCNINIDTMRGIFNIENTIKSVMNIMEPSDSLLIIYDDIIENPLVSRHIEEANKLVEGDSRVYFIPTLSFELEILMINNIEFIYNTDIYNDLAREIREIYRKTESISIITSVTKNDKRYNDMYEKARKVRADKREYKYLNSIDFEKAITIESICKDILNRIFNRSDIRPIRDCWVHNCCYKTREYMCKYTGFNLKRIREEEEHGNDLCKIRTIVQETSFYNLLWMLNELLNAKEHSDIAFSDIINIPGEVLNEAGEI